MMIGYPQAGAKYAKFHPAYFHKDVETLPLRVVSVLRGRIAMLVVARVRRAEIAGRRIAICVMCVTASEICWPDSPLAMADWPPRRKGASYADGYP
jgi:hypothetical protein